eukprot:CAMPEP_0203789268 /NCGR_PEP_ID=MMETSP0100_2-20121128/3323_1 /ASSEMBLY_ACC=CAM_ASM_000210 /TAXON_ID=96639 /ORGANISM=" , Strain NY0313808BC1" /LENGTH=283 /DNA_ID=CAMNT_0050692133 /DNA_START=120 /DNA_END=968 /DNA_ORIENTATION=+
MRAMLIAWGLICLPCVLGANEEGQRIRSVRRSKSVESDPVLMDGEKSVMVECEMRGKGKFDVVVVPEWAPLGAERFLDLVKDKFFDGTALFRAVPHFLCQFGIAKDHSKNRKWHTIEDDPKLGIRIKKGTLAFAGGGPSTRGTQMFVATTNGAWPGLGEQPWENPFAYVPMEDYERVWSQLYVGYGDMSPFNKDGVDVGRIWSEGYSYLEENFPKLDYLEYCRLKPLAVDKNPDAGEVVDLVSWLIPNPDTCTYCFELICLAIISALVLLVALSYKKSNVKES